MGATAANARGPATSALALCSWHCTSHWHQVTHHASRDEGCHVTAAQCFRMSSHLVHRHCVCVCVRGVCLWIAETQRYRPSANYAQESYSIAGYRISRILDGANWAEATCAVRVVKRLRRARLATLAERRGRAIRWLKRSSSPGPVAEQKRRGPLIHDVYLQTWSLMAEAHQTEC